MKIPVFVSSPTALSPSQRRTRQRIFRLLDNLNLEPRALGQSDYPTQLPLREVHTIARHCSGAVILGFEQIRADAGTIKPGTPKQTPITTPISFPTPWNQLEAGILFSMGLPMLVFREPSISGGIFDTGVTDVFIHTMPTPKLSQRDRAGLQDVFLKWQANVRRHYYGESNTNIA
jgi:hypothetical protein